MAINDETWPVGISSANPSDPSTPSMELDLDKPAEVKLDSGTWNSDTTTDAGALRNTSKQSWTAQGGGSEHGMSYQGDVIWDGGDETIAPDGTITLVHLYDNSGDSSYTTNDGPADLAWTIGSLAGSTNLVFPNGSNILWSTFNTSAKTKVVLHTGGRGKISNLFQLTATATDDATEMSIPPPQISVAGYTLNASGVAYAIFPDGATIDITPQTGAPYYDFTVGAGKYLSHFEVFVRQPYPNYPSDAGSYGLMGPPLGWPIYEWGGKQAGHAWFKLSTGAPSAAISQFTTPDCSQWLNQEFGYGPINDSLLSIYPPVAAGPGTNYMDNGSANIDRFYIVGFQGPGVINGLSHAENIHSNPGTWNSATHNCVHEVVITGNTSGKQLPIGDATPEFFGFALPPSDP